MSQHIIKNSKTGISQRGHRCSYATCTSVQHRKETNLRFFRFPINSERCREWVNKCGRADLETKTSTTLNCSYRVCGKHFEDTMFLNDFKNSLQGHACPSNIPFINKENDETVAQSDNSDDDVSTATALQRQAQFLLKIHHNYSLTIPELERKMKESRYTAKQSQRKLRVAELKVNQLNRKLVSLQSIVKNLLKTNELSDTRASHLKCWLQFNDA